MIMWDGNEIHDWILKQDDCWSEEHLAFHIGNLIVEYYLAHPEAQDLSPINKQELDRAISVEAHLAKHTKMKLRAQKTSNE